MASKKAGVQRPTYGMTLRLFPELRDFIYEQAYLYGESPSSWVVKQIEKMEEQFMTDQKTYADQVATKSHPKQPKES